MNTSCLSDRAGDVMDVDNGPGGYNGPGRRRAGLFVQSGRTLNFPVPVLRTSTTGRTFYGLSRVKRTGPSGGGQARVARRGWTGGG
jgi:hypothetical protein